MIRLRRRTTMIWRRFTGWTQPCPMISSGDESAHCSSRARCLSIRQATRGGPNCCCGNVDRSVPSLEIPDSPILFPVPRERHCPTLILPNVIFHIDRRSVRKGERSPGSGYTPTTHVLPGDATKSSTLPVGEAKRRATSGAMDTTVHSLTCLTPSPAHKSMEPVELDDHDRCRSFSYDEFFFCFFLRDIRRGVGKVLFSNPV